MAQAIDPVCGMTVDTETARHQSEYNGTTYYFCASGCKRAFDADPTSYSGRNLAGGGNAEGGEHTGHAGHTGTHS
ncbi:MAG: YHS domain-containing protein [Chloroflexota bacterium]|nr:YHS domain-containing protein [Chloroflexota bacterium]MDQ5864533.1 YHS domain-containing protein [Chloroflexota bacterium]